MKIKRLLCIAASVASLAIGAFGAMPVLAQGLDTGLQDLGQTINLPATDPRVIAANIINVALGLLAIIMVILIVFAGFLWMTAGGDDAKVAKAKAYIRNAIIGLVIILSSWALARFILTRLMQATGNGGGTTNTGGTGGTGGFGGGGGNATTFSIRSITPSGEVDTRKVIVKIVFTRTVDAASAQAPGVIIVERVSDGAVVAGTVEVAGTAVRFRPNTPCPEPNADRFCFEENTEYRVRVSSNLESSGGQTLTCGGFSPACEGTFRAGTTVDVTPPSVSITYPITGFAVSADALVDVNAYASDETAISYVSFTDNGSFLGDDAPFGRSPRQFDAHVQWDTAGFTAGERRTLVATAYDVDSGSAQSAPVEVIVRASHCFDGTQNSGETGLDCGGDPSAADYCGACRGESCVENTDCSSGVCVNGVCVEQPIITGVDPLDGAPGTYVTLRGVNFGSSGSVSFLGSGTPVQASAPESCMEAGRSSWSSRQVIIQVPEGAQNGPLRLANGTSGLSDDTNAPPNPYLNDFVVNDAVRPGICAIEPNEGVPGTPFVLQGERFGTVSAGIRFGERNLSTTSWTEQRLESSIPNVAVGTYPVSVTVGSLTSNTVGMRVRGAEDSVGAPEIVEISPSQGPVGAYVTITGRRFGSSVGSVFFVNRATGETALADTNFPAGCAEGFWKDSAVTVKVPTVFTQAGSGRLSPGAYAVYLRPSRVGSSESNRVDFLVNTDPLTPGICSVTPRIAPIGTSIAIRGEYFTDGPGTVTYHRNVVGESSEWSDKEIVSRVPTGAQTGPVVVRPQSNGLNSNPYPIEIRNCNEAVNVCGSGEECCGDGACRAEGSCEENAGTAMYAWQFSTGVIPLAPRVVEQCEQGSLPSPAPWSKRNGGTEVCVNDVMLMVFTTALDPSTVTREGGNIVIQRCTGTDPDACASAQDLDLGALTLGSDTNGRQYLQINQGTLATNTWYQVKLRTGIRGAGENGLNMEERTRECGAGFAYCYTFRTRNDASPCVIGSVQVAPDPYTSYELGEQIPYQAMPQPEGDICRVLACEPYAWRWQTSDSRATVTHAPAPSRQGCVQTVTSVAETGPSNPVQIRATAEGVTGAGDLFIRLIPPEVTAHGPDCDAACVNARIWAEFNVPLNPSSVNSNSVWIERCRNESCRELAEPPRVSLSNAQIRLGVIPGTSGTDGRFLIVEPRSSGGSPVLEPGRFYRVVLRGGQTNGILSSSNVPLSGMNHPDGFAWTFRVMGGQDAFCSTDRLDVAPSEKYESRVGATQAFSASPFSKPDRCSDRGQILLSNQGYDWSIADVNVAAFLPGLTGTGTVDTGSNRPTGCSDVCTLLGSQGVYGSAARCGNGRIEPAFEECDGGTGCNSICLFEPVATVNEGGTCGDGNRQPNEDCDFGRTCRGAPTESGIQDGTDCTSASAASVCTSAGGRCETRLVRGCSLNCRHLGSQSGGSVCGNGDVADGEDCDDGNLTNGDGCSANCVREGSRSDLSSLCGNGGRLEPGESCEVRAGGSWPEGCDRQTCLHTGTLPCVGFGPTAIMCCGNGLTEDGEDYDDGNTESGDGVSATCLFEGSSVSYAEPSFCGDGVAGTGESASCEVAPSGPDGLTDGIQVAEIVGQGTMTDGVMSTEVRASYDGVSGAAIYGLRCGFDLERLCSPDGASIDPDIGLRNDGCCSERPELTANLPPNESADACRNTLIEGSFNVEMDEASLRDGVVVAQAVQADECPDGQVEVARVGERLDGFKGMLVRAWRAIVRFFGGRPASAQVYCAGGVTGKLTLFKAVSTLGVPFTKFAFAPDHVLLPNTAYRVILSGDSDLSNNGRTDGKAGIRSKAGVVASRNWSWSFTTGEEICTVDEVVIEDQSAEHPYLFTKADETHPFAAYARSRRGSASVSIAPTAEYAWEWQNWALSNRQIAELIPAVDPNPNASVSASLRDVRSAGASGSGYVNARVLITTDTVIVPSTAGRVVQDSKPIVVNICERPWPSKAEAPFRDEEGSPSLYGTAFESGPFYHMSMMYCMDAGEPGPLSDLPNLVINAVPQNAVDRSQGILRQYLFTFSVPELKKDAIGMRIAENPMHLSPEEWYRSKGFSGNPTALTVDGYQAIRDGRTVYISAVNTDGSDQENRDLYSNIYILSYNDDAESVTRQIYDELVSSMMFNTNFAEDVSSSCEDASGNLASDSKGLPVACSADVECASYGQGMVCANFKGKLQRDLIRLGHFQSMTQAFEKTKRESGSYPALGEGSYLPNMSVSLWPSWDGALSEATGAKLPDDPINRFVTCGRCSLSGTACVSNADCRAEGETCAAEDGYDPATCWNAESVSFSCAIEDPNGEPTSRFYQYRSLDQGRRYELAAEFEVPPPDPENLSRNWWKPTLSQEIRQCQTVNELGRFCSSDSDCRTCPNGSCLRCRGGSNVGQACSRAGDCPGGTCADAYPLVEGSCRATGARYVYTDICRGERMGQSSSCGDGVLDTDPSHRACVGGTRDRQSCSSDADCSGGTCLTGELCELSGATALRNVSCTTIDGQSGNKQQVCDACRLYVDDVRNPGCFASGQCGDGRIQGHCNANDAIACVSASDCRNRYAQELQVALAALGYEAPNPPNGVYDTQTTAAVRAFQTAERIQVDGVAGPQTISRLKAVLGARGLGCADPNACFVEYAGYACTDLESCDDGSLNGTYGHCNRTCTGYGGYCGDGMVSSSEICDRGASNVEWTASDPANSCNLSCSGKAGSCGDGVVTAPNEACEIGQTESTSKAVCASDFSIACDTDADCPSGRCGTPQGTFTDASVCQFLRICVGDSPSNRLGSECDEDEDCGGGTCSVPVQTVRYRTCSESCGYGNWGLCSVPGSCGDGVKDPQEECDDGNDDSTDSCTAFCTLNACNDGFVYKDVEECDMGPANGQPCETAEYGSACSSCSTSCKFQLTQGGFCGDEIVQAGTAEQCDGNSTVDPTLTCRALGYDYAKEHRTISLGLGLGVRTVDAITCSESCGFSGCMYCGDRPDVIPAGEEAYYQGRIEGMLYDTLFQQPVPGARVALFYRGLQVALTQSGDDGYFEFTGLDRHTGCGQYRLAVDSYSDNPNTALDESKRGGYATVQTASFAPHSSRIDRETSTVGLFTAVALSASSTGLTTAVRHPSRNYTIPQFNMFPRLGENEYVVQFWWDPRISSSLNTRERIIAAFQDRDDAGRDSLYTSAIGEMHDLVVRLPFTYRPGTYEHCSQTIKPAVYHPDGTSTGHGRNQGLNEDGTFRTDENGQLLWTPGSSGIDYADALIGMKDCTNKIRATAGRTCEGTNVPQSLLGKLACSVDRDCSGFATLKYRYPSATCPATSDSEPSRSGSDDVLSGSEGAYLFCYHPELSVEERKEPDCTNFVVPPQSVFISGRGGQYDILISAYRAFNRTSHDPPSIREWLKARRGRILVYDRYGLRDTVTFGADGVIPTGGASVDVNAGWNRLDNLIGRDICLPVSERDASQAITMPKIAYLHSNIISTVWTPLSIDTTNDRVLKWNGGYQGADFRYFADLYTLEMMGTKGVGNGICWEKTYRARGFREDPNDTSTRIVSYFPTDYLSGRRVCNDGNVHFTGDYNTYPACVSADRARCPEGTYCRTHEASDSGPCIQTCTTDSNCGSWENAFCGGLFNTAAGSNPLNTGRD